MERHNYAAIIRHQPSFLSVGELSESGISGWEPFFFLDNLISLAGIGSIKGNCRLCSFYGSFSLELRSAAASLLFWMTLRMLDHNRLICCYRCLNITKDTFINQNKRFFDKKTFLR